MTRTDLREYSRLYYLAFPWNHRKVCDSWRNRNKKREQLRQQQWGKQNRKRHNFTTQLWRKRNPERANELQRQNHQRNRITFQKHENLRRARKRNAQISDQALVQKIYERARELRKWFDVVVDHVIPLSKGGAHSSENLQIIYAEENARKGARLDYIPSVRFLC